MLLLAASSWAADWAISGVTKLLFLLGVELISGLLEAATADELILLLSKPGVRMPLVTIAIVLVSSILFARTAVGLMGCKTMKFNY